MEIYRLLEKSLAVNIPVKRFIGIIPKYQMITGYKEFSLYADGCLMERNGR